MKNLLIVTYYFPPLGLGGTQRIAKFVKYLPQFGWSPTVVTVKPIVYWALDESLLRDVDGAHIIRTESLDPQRMMARFGGSKLSESPRPGKSGLLSFMNQKMVPFFFVPDSKILWQFNAVRACRELLKEKRFDALLTTSPPHSVHLIGHAIAKRFNIAWLADFRDGWAGGQFVHEPTVLHYKINKRLQNKVVNEAAAVVTVSPGIELSLIASALQPEKFYFIPNGFDPDDFQLHDATVQKRMKDEYTMCYSGTINRFADPLPFLDALLLLKQKEPELCGSLRVQFVGLDTTGSFTAQVKNHGLQNIIDIVGHKDHADSVTFLKSANALLLIAKPRQSDPFIPGKTFEYIGAQKPVFAISTSRYTNELLAGYEPAHVVDSFEPEKIYQNLKEFLQTKRHLNSFDPCFVNQFNRMHQTNKLAEILDTITRN